MNKPRVRCAVIVALATGLVACGGTESADVTTSPATVTTVAEIATTTTIESNRPTGLVPVTDPDASTTVPETTTTIFVAPVTTPVVPTTTASTVPAATTTTEPLANQTLILLPEGIGSAQFGAAPDGVIEYVSSILGSNTADTLWGEPTAFSACEGTRARAVSWGVLSLLFGDESGVASGRDHFIGWEYGLVSAVGDEPVGLHTPGGVALGSRVVDLRAEFPDISINGGEDDLDIVANFYVSDSFRGLLSGTNDDDFVTVFFGGCGG